MAGLFDTIAEHAGRAPEAPALISPRITLSFSALLDSSRRIASRLARAGVTPGQVVAVGATAELQTIVSLALLQLGATSMSATPLLLKLYGEHIDWLVVDGLMSFPAARAISLDQGFMAGLPATAPRNDVHPWSDDEMVRIVFSSGSTGAPKGVPLTVAALTARIEAANRAWITERPFFSLLSIDTASGVLSTFASLMAGEPTLVAGSPAENLRLIADHRVALVKTSPAKLADLIAEQRRLPIVQHRFAIAAAGSLLPERLASACEDAFGVTPVYLFGSTEAGTAARGAFDPAHPNRMGALVDDPHLEVAVVDAAGRPVSPGLEGELQLRRAGLPANYWPDGPALTNDDGWFVPGDRARITVYGVLDLAGRVDDLVNAGGVKVNLAELDRWLADIPGFADVATFSWQNELGLNEIGVAYVSERAPDADSVLARIRSQVPNVQVGALIRVPSIPRAGLDKVNRGALAALVRSDA